MKNSKIFACILAIMMIMASFNPAVIKAEALSTGNEMNDTAINVTHLEKNMEEAAAVASEANVVTHHTPDTALFLNADYIGKVLMDSATSEENWYYFYADAKQKVTALLEQPSDGDYDLILYMLDIDTGVLTPVASSGYGGNVIDRLSMANDSEAYYFLQVLPATASTAEDAVYYFIINMTGQYDSNEPNDNPTQANTVATSNIRFSGTIDNVYDQDWTKFTVQGTKNYQVELNNVPSGAQYTVNIYDENLNVKSALASEGNGKTYASLGAGTYYICIASTNNQYSPTAAYTFQMNEVHSVNSKFYTTKSGHQVEITNTAVYVDGAQVNLNWNFVYNINYIRTQEFEITSATAVDANSYQNGTFIDGQNMNASSDCFRVKINNFNMSYYCNNPYDSWTKNFGANAWTYFYIDAATGKTIGTDANYYHTNMGIKNRFNKF